MSTWFELGDMAMGMAKQAVPQDWVTAADIMNFLTTAQNKYQNATNMAKRSSVITLDPNSSNGEYDLPLDFKSVPIITYARDGSTFDPDPIDLTDYATFLNWAHAYQAGSLPAQAPAALPQYGNTLRAAIYNGKLYIYPWQAATGVLNLKWQPKLTAWSPSAVANYPGSTDLVAYMRANSPEECFAQSEDGIMWYAVAMIYFRSPLGLGKYMAEYQIAMGHHNNAIRELKRVNVDYPSKAKPHYSLGDID